MQAQRSMCAGAGKCCRLGRRQGWSCTNEGATVGQVVEPLPVKLIMGFIIGYQAPMLAVRQRLEASYGRVDLTTDVWPFTATRYYESEMGPQLQRQLWSFARLVAPEALAGIKCDTNAVEQAFTWWDGQRCRRWVNVDPGYVDQAKLVLATTKDRQHRLYLGRGIYGEVTLRFTGGRFEPWEWTYPDYRTPEYRAFFEKVRRRYRQQLAARVAEPDHV
jgi:hypothetical protein